MSKMHLLKHKLYKKSNLQFSYWTNSLSGSEIQRNYILLPPGPASGRYFSNLVRHIPQNTKIYAFDYPGRGHSLPTGDNTVRGISTSVMQYIEALNLNEFSVIGVSYGTTVATEIAQSKKYNINNIYLIAPGEYIPTVYHPLIYIIFFPAMFSEGIRSMYRHLLLKLKIFDTFPQKNLKDILTQWFGILQYTLNVKIPVENNCRILIYSEDKIVRSGSLRKIAKIYPNNTVLGTVKAYDRHLSYSPSGLLEEFLNHNT